ncbi:MAG: ABC transporter permease [Deltaproteobacteria bacterium]|nr:ABC transporter permease [Deltaproteobacteria bacterium]
MLQLIVIAWRNVWRNARRSLITMITLSLGVAGLVGLNSYRQVAFDMILHDVTAGLIGHIQVHGLGYQEAPAVTTVVKHPVQVEAALRGALPGALVERRVIGAGLAGAGDRSAPVMMLGLEPGPSHLYRVVEGELLSAARTVLVGKELARDLEVGVGQEVVLVSQAADGSVANDRYRVGGIFVSSSAELDAAAVALPLAEAQSFFALGEGVHQIVVRLPTERDDVSAEVSAVRTALDLKTLEALSWSEILPEMTQTIESKKKSKGVLDFVIFLIVGLGVLNAMTMAVFERTHELGVLASLGTRPRRLLAMVLLEAFWQAAIGFALGVVIATATLYAVGTVDLGTIMQGDIMGVRMPSRMVLRLYPETLIGAAFTSFLTALLGALIPAARAARLKPVEALRHA